VQLSKISIIFESSKLFLTKISGCLAERKTYQYNNAWIGYLKAGSGSRVAVCFHGYGEQAESFAFLEKYAGNQYTFYAVDLPYHGQTVWQEGLSCTIAEIEAIVSGILRQEGAEYAAGITLLGFSLGGRVALHLFETGNLLVTRLVLLAPDGLKVNAWYWLATQTRAGNKFFAFTMKHPGWFLGILKGMNKLKLVNASIYKFVHHYIGDAEVRRLLYTRWTALRKIKPGLKRIKARITAGNTVVRLVYGSHDRIILSSVGEKFRKGTEKQCSISIIHAGHQVLHEKHAAELLPALLE
jgi:pimeloyl-ACP methyl ester carboxylesterase